MRIITSIHYNTRYNGGSQLENKREGYIKKKKSFAHKTKDGINYHIYVASYLMKKAICS